MASVHQQTAQDQYAAVQVYLGRGRVRGVVRLVESGLELEGCRGFAGDQANLLQRSLVQPVKDQTPTRPDMLPKHEARLHNYLGTYKQRAEGGANLGRKGLLPEVDTGTAFARL